MRTSLRNLPREIASFLGSIITNDIENVPFEADSSSSAAATSEHSAISTGNTINHTSNDNIESALPDVDASSSAAATSERSAISTGNINDSIESALPDHVDASSSDNTSQHSSEASYQDSLFSDPPTHPPTPKRRSQPPTDIYTSVNMPEIQSLLPFDKDSEGYKASIKINGPLPLGFQITEAHNYFATHPVTEIALAEQREIYHPVTKQKLLYKRDDGWFDVRTRKQIYDNKGNRATDDVDFQISRVRKCAATNQFQVEFTDWKSLDPLDMDFDQLTGNGSNKFMVQFLSYLQKYVQVGKWQPLGGRKQKARNNIGMQLETQTLVKAIATANDLAQSEALSKFVMPDEPLMVTTDSTGCLIASVINVLRLNEWKQFSDALNSVMSVEMLSRYCNDNNICVLQRLKKCTGAIDFLMMRYDEVVPSKDIRESELYILFDSNICHCVSIDLKRSILYDSASESRQPYVFNEEVLCLLGFSRANSNLQLRKMINVGKKFGTQVNDYGNNKRKLSASH